jgi:hypothetical protein
MRKASAVSGRSGSAGCSPGHVAGIAMPYQVAQKLHASTDPDDPPEFLNDRVRDIPGLLLIKDHSYPGGPTVELSAACFDVFHARAAEATALDLPGPTLATTSHRKQRRLAQKLPRLAVAVGITLTLERCDRCTERCPEDRRHPAVALVVKRGGPLLTALHQLPPRTGGFEGGQQVAKSHRPGAFCGHDWT